MKRSEILEKIVETMETIRLIGPKSEYKDLNYDDQQANEILDSLESLGMLPPLVFLDHFDRFDNVWESEDPVEAPNLASEAVEEYNVDQLSEEEVEELLTACKKAIKKQQDARKGKK